MLTTILLLITATINGQNMDINNPIGEDRTYTVSLDTGRGKKVLAITFKDILIF